MSLRPAVAALKCCACRSAVFWAVLGTTTPRVTGFGARRLRQLAPSLSASHRRLFSSPAQEDDQSATAPPQAEVEQPDPDAADKHWFLEVEPPRHPPSLHAPALPDVPSDAPSLLQPMIKYIYQDMGLDDLALLDLRELDPPAALGRNLIMLLGTARSERHLHISAGRFVRWLRRKYKVNAKADGLIGPGELKTKLRRLRKRAKLMGNNTTIVPSGDHGLTTGWICVNFSTGEVDVGETASFDRDGRYSGFGAAQTGTTVVVQCMTEARRGELDLETLWQEMLRRGLERGKRVRGEATADKHELEALVSSKVQLAPSSPTSQWQALRQASQQQRHFSTSARRLETPAQACADDDRESHRDETPPAEANMAQDDKDGFIRLRQIIDALHASASPLTQNQLQVYITSALKVESPATASERLTLVDELILTGQERGLKIDSTDFLVDLIISTVISPAYDEDMARAQKNLELLLSQKNEAMQESQVMRLMHAYAQRDHWDRFWSTFASPAQFLKPRSGDVYELAFHQLALTGDVQRCREAVHWMYLDMQREEPPVEPVGKLFEALRACTSIAEPSATAWIYALASSRGLDNEKKRKFERNEFVQLLANAAGRRRQLGYPPWNLCQAEMKQKSQHMPQRPAPEKEGGRLAGQHDQSSARTQSSVRNQIKASNRTSARLDPVAMSVMARRRGPSSARTQALAWKQEKAPNRASAQMGPVVMSMMAGRLDQAPLRKQSKVPGGA